MNWYTEMARSYGQVRHADYSGRSPVCPGKVRLA